MDNNRTIEDIFRDMIPLLTGYWEAEDVKLPANGFTIYLKKERIKNNIPLNETQTLMSASMNAIINDIKLSEMLYVSGTLRDDKSYEVLKDAADQYNALMKDYEKDFEDGSKDILEAPILNINIMPLEFMGKVLIEMALPDYIYYNPLSLDFLLVFNPESIAISTFDEDMDIPGLIQEMKRKQRENMLLNELENENINEIDEEERITPEINNTMFGRTQNTSNLFRHSKSEDNNE